MLQPKKNRFQTYFRGGRFKASGPLGFVPATKSGMFRVGTPSLVAGHKPHVHRIIKIQLRMSFFTDSPQRKMTSVFLFASFHRKKGVASLPLAKIAPVKG